MEFMELFLFLIIYPIIVIIYIIKQYYIPDTKKILTNRNFKNIELLETNSKYSLYKAEKAGDFYVILAISDFKEISTNMISDLELFALEKHYHNKVIIYNNSNIPEKIRNRINSFNIILIHSTDYKNFLHKKVSNTEEPVMNSNSFETKNTHMDDDSDDSIKDGRIANSIFGSLFGNKPTRL